MIKSGASLFIKQKLRTARLSPDCQGQHRNNLKNLDELNRVTVKSVPNIGVAVFRYDIIYTHTDGKKYTGETSRDPKRNITTKYYDGLGRLKFVASDSQATQFTTYEYDANGNRTSIRHPNGISEVYTYFKNNLLKTLINKNAAGTTLENFSYTYTYDLSNNLVSKTDVKVTTRYTYDSVNRLKSVTEPSGKVTEYNASGEYNNEFIKVWTIVYSINFDTTG